LGQRGRRQEKGGGLRILGGVFWGRAAGPPGVGRRVGVNQAACNEEIETKNQI
jgi:hypothetical protein